MRLHLWTLPLLVLGIALICSPGAMGQQENLAAAIQKLIQSLQNFLKALQSGNSSNPTTPSTQSTTPSTPKSSTTPSSGSSTTPSSGSSTTKNSNSTTTSPLSPVSPGSSGGCCPHGNLKVQGKQLVGADGNPVQLRGMSLFWSQWDDGSKFYNEETVKCVKCSWNADIIRAAMAVDQGGYLSNPDKEYAKLEAVVDAAIKNCMYVLIDWHYTDSAQYPEKAVEFFSKISKKCAGKCNCLYETYNEPTSNDWSSQLKPYHEKVISAIRQNDPNGVVIAGTPTWDQDVDKAAADPIKDVTNVMYTLHFYAATHKDDIRAKAQTALDKGLPLFVTEYGTTPASGDGAPDLAETKKWYDFLDKNKISYINWSITDKAESSAALQKGAGPADVCGDSKLTESGKFVKEDMTKKNAKPAGC